MKSPTVATGSGTDWFVSADDTMVYARGLVSDKGGLLVDARTARKIAQAILEVTDAPDA